MDGSRTKVRRFQNAVRIAGITGSVILIVAWRCLIAYGRTRGIGWIGGLDDFNLLIIVALALIPLMLAGYWLDRDRSKRLGVENIGGRVKRLKAEEKRWEAEEKSGLVFSVPRPRPGKNWPAMARFSIALSALTFASMFVVATISVYIKRHLFNVLGSLATAALCALFILFITPITTWFFLPKLRLILISDGIISRQGSSTHFTPYSAIQKVRIVPGRDGQLGPHLYMLMSGRKGKTWHHYHLGPDASIAAVTEAFQSRGLIAESPIGRPIDEDPA